MNGRTVWLRSPKTDFFSRKGVVGRGHGGIGTIDADQPTFTAGAKITAASPSRGKGSPSGRWPIFVIHSRGPKRLFRRSCTVRWTELAEKSRAPVDVHCRGTVSKSAGQQTEAVHTLGQFEIAAVDDQRGTLDSTPVCHQPFRCCWQPRVTTGP